MCRVRGNKRVTVHRCLRVTVHSVPPRYCSLGASARVFVRIMHEKPETAGAKMSVLCSFCVHHVAVNGEAVNSNASARCFRDPFLQVLTFKMAGL